MAIIGYISFIPENKNTKTGEDEFVLASSTFGIKVNADGSKGVVQTSATRTVSSLANAVKAAETLSSVSPLFARELSPGRVWEVTSDNPAQTVIASEKPSEKPAEKGGKQK